MSTSVATQKRHPKYKTKNPDGISARQRGRKRPMWSGTLSSGAIEALAEMAEEDGLKKSQMLEILIRRAARSRHIPLS